MHVMRIGGDTPFKASKHWQVCNTPSDAVHTHCEYPGFFVEKSGFFMPFWGTVEGA